MRLTAAQRCFQKSYECGRRRRRSRAGQGREVDHPSGKVVWMQRAQRNAGRERGRDKRWYERDAQTGRHESLLGRPFPRAEIDLGPISHPTAGLGKSGDRAGESFDPTFGSKLGKPEHRARRQPMPGRQRDQHRVVHQVPELERRVRLAADQRHISTAVQQLLDLSPAVALHQRERDARVLGPERRQSARHERRVRAVERADPQPPGLQRSQRGQILRRGVEPFEHRLGVRQQAAALLCEAYAAGQPVEQPYAHRALERRDLPRHRGLGVAQRLRGRAQRSAPSDLAEDLEPGGM